MYIPGENIPSPLVHPIISLIFWSKSASMRDKILPISNVYMLVLIALVKNWPTSPTGSTPENI